MHRTILMAACLGLMVGCSVKFTGEATVMERWDKRPKQGRVTQTNVIAEDQASQTGFVPSITEAVNKEAK